MAITVRTQHPVALDSLDHIHPCGTARDNSVNPAFNRKLYELIPAKDVRLLDIGCAGGGLVKSILDDGGFAVGLEGSDYSWKAGRAEWATIPGNLVTADARHPFSIRNGSSCWPTMFNVVTAWEFFEHIEEGWLWATCFNIKGNLDDSHCSQCGHRLSSTTFFIGSINPGPHEIYHVTQQPKEWWLEKFQEYGFEHAPDIEEHFGRDLVRTEGFPIALRVK